MFPMTTPTSGRGTPDGRRDASMSLLVDIAAQALDPGYAEAAVRRAAEPGPPPRGRALPVAVGAGLVAALLSIAAAQAHAQAPALDRSRQALLDQVDTQTAAVGAMQVRLNRLRDTTTRLRDQLLTTSRSGNALADRLGAEELAAGTTAVSGPGLRVVLDDAPPSGGADNRVLDSDLQAAVNALWAAGAEAVTVGSQRLTAQSAIRQAGNAILVNFEPLTPPYVVSAIGDPVELETRFGASQTAARLRTLSQLYGLAFHYARVDELRLPAAPGLTLRYARPAKGVS
jgi:uncharacterized protein YlxW (UPF0749 family)